MKDSLRRLEADPTLEGSRLAHERRRETTAPDAHGPTQDALGNRATLALLRNGRLQRKAASKEREPAAAEGMLSAQPRAPDIGGVLVGGRALDESTRGFMESRFGERFDEVRIHTDDRAGEVAGDLLSRAFTVGRDIVFGAGQYAPEATEGRRLIAHELAHVVQQRHTTGPVGGEKDTERDAREAAHQVAAGSTPTVRERATPGSVQKDGDVREVPVLKGWTTDSSSELVAGGVMVFVVLDTSLNDAVSGKAWESSAEPGVLFLSPSYPAGHEGYVVSRKNWESRWKNVRLVSGPPEVKPAPVVPPPPKQQPKQPKAQPTPPKSAPPPQPQPAEPKTEPRTTPEVEGEEPFDFRSLLIQPEKPISEQVSETLQHDPAAAPYLAPRMSDGDLEALTPLNRALLLWAMAASPKDDGLDVDTVARILDKTPDHQVTELEDQLFANNGIMLRLMAQRVKGNEDAKKLIDSLTRLWQRGELPEGKDDGKRRWMKNLMGDPIKMTRSQHDQMLADAPATLQRKIDSLRTEIGFDDANRAWRNNAVGDVVDFWGGLKKPQTAAELMYSPEGFLGNPYRSADYAEKLTGQGDFFAAGQQLKMGQALNQNLFNQWETYRGGSIESGESLEEGIKIGAVTIIVVATAGYAAPIVFGGSVALIGGEGVTVLTAGTGAKLGATALTTGALTLGGGALGSATRGGLDLATGQPVTSEELSKGFNTGAQAGASVGMGYGLNMVVGLGPGSPVTWGNVAKSGFFVHGPANATASVLGGTLDRQDPEQIARQGLYNYGFGALGGTGGTALAPVVKGSRPAQTALRVGLGSTIPAAGVWMSGGSDTQIQQALLSGAAVSFATSLMPQTRPTLPSARSLRAGMLSLSLQGSIRGVENVPGLGGRNPTASIPGGPDVAWVMHAPGTSARTPGGIIVPGEASVPRNVTPGFGFGGPAATPAAPSWATVPQPGSYAPAPIPFTVRVAPPTQAVSPDEAAFNQSFDATFAQDPVGEQDEFQTTQRLVRGNLGERTGTEALASMGHTILMYKPSILGTNQGGIDMVTRHNGVLHLVDNKALSRSGNVASVSALTTNRAQNLAQTRAELAQAAADPDRPAAERALFQQAVNDIDSGNYVLVVTNANVLSPTEQVPTGVTQNLANQGIGFIDVR